MKAKRMALAMRLVVGVERAEAAVRTFWNIFGDEV
jgi:hypothetical protein